MKDLPAPTAPTRHGRWIRAAAWTLVAVLITAGGAVGLVVNTRPGSGVDGDATREETALSFVEEQLRPGNPGRRVRRRTRR